MLGLTRQERGIVAFLIAGLILGSLVSIYRRYLVPPALPEVDPRVVATFDSLSAGLSEQDRSLQPNVAQEPAVTAPNEKPWRSKKATRSKPAPNSIDINSAGVDELTQLPGIGQVTANRIVSWRDRHGRFHRPKDLLEVKGIGPRVLEKISPFIILGEER